MLRRIATATLAIGGLISGLNTAPLSAQELASPEASQPVWNVEPTHYAETTANEMAASEAVEMQLSNCGVCETDSCGSYWDQCCSNNWFADGWLEQGYTANPDHPNSNFNGPLGFNDRADDYQLNQLYLTFGKHIDEDACQFDIGGRVDVLYGTDYFWVESRGLERERDNSRKWNGQGPRQNGDRALNGLALPQFYAEAFLPVGAGLKTKVGHFYSLLGYETVPAPENFFYSHSYSYVYGNPKTHTGFVTSYSPTDCFEIQAGMTNGWDNFETIDDKYGFLFGASWSNGVTGLSYAMHNGAGEAAGEGDVYAHTIVYTRKLGYRWNYALVHDYGIEQDGFLNDSFMTEDAKYYSFTNYLYYDWSNELSFGGRFEWFCDEDNSRIQQVPVGLLFSGRNYYNVTLGANWKPCEHVLVRPEARYDWSDLNPIGTTGVFNDFTKDDMYTFAVDVILFF